MPEAATPEMTPEAWGENADPELLEAYNYAVFGDDHERWMRFDESPPLGQKAPSFPLWNAEDRAETTLRALWKENLYTIVEFGSFT